MRIRPLQLDDEATARVPGRAALPPPPAYDDAAADRHWSVRFRRLVVTDPEGCWAAEEEDGTIAGAAMALVRDGIWGLSFLAVHPDVQARGIGKQLIDATLRYADGTRARLIASSSDPKAMRRYSRAGFDLRPCVAAAGIVDRSTLPDGLRSTEAGEEALELAAPLGRAIRGGAYDPDDLRIYLDAGGHALRHGDDGLVIVSPSGPSLLLARDDEVAADLLWSALASSGHGSTISVDFVMAGNDWAIRTSLDAGLALSPDGPMFTAGDLGPLRPWIPAGTFL